ncbi:MAG TPA: response regulator [Candidatus Saccharimonadales bacterium]|nr:response regulator [Candidatus Saccharimonadales bacterium]
MKILIVDNNVSTVTTLSALLADEGPFEIEVAYGGQECLDKLNVSPDYDLVLLDIMMPGVSGMKVCEEMVKDSKLRNIPVLLMSSAMPIPPDEFHDSLEKYGDLVVVKGAIEKPFIMKELLAKIHQISKKI